MLNRVAALIPHELPCWKEKSIVSCWADGAPAYLRIGHHAGISGTAWDTRRPIQTYHEEQPLRIILPQRGSCREAVTARVAPPRIGGSPRGTAVVKPPAARGLVQRSCHRAGCSTGRIEGQATEDDVAVTTATNVETLRVAETRATASG
ncbi:hypothetical protein NDU88_008153 [Pleurodeles waltl]|uniref:Uncharacterized protein n=1 Tax=Pleurodeles waltl TaxID=8319 RepID=A0AAV7RTX7_PLEWA|nr:hypothetical protein NDU88_008153 [Pleurodeles waltl]